MSDLSVITNLERCVSESLLRLSLRLGYWSPCQPKTYYQTFIISRFVVLHTGTETDWKREDITENMSGIQICISNAVRFAGVQALESERPG